MLRNILALVAALAICFAAAGIGGYWTSLGLGAWYSGLRKPPWNPPNWVFGPVWTTLYIVMAVAAWLVWKQVGISGGKVPLGLFATQLILNAAWTGLFFALRNPGLAFGEVLVLWAVILATAVAFRPVSPVAAGLLLPYLLWVAFAATLNGAIWYLNR